MNGKTRGRSFFVVTILYLLASSFTFGTKVYDIILLNSPKSVTTWLKALVFALVYRQELQTLESHPLLDNNSQSHCPLSKLSTLTLVKILLLGSSYTHFS